MVPRRPSRRSYISHHIPCSNSFSNRHSVSCVVCIECLSSIRVLDYDIESVSSIVARTFRDNHFTRSSSINRSTCRCTKVHTIVPMKPLCTYGARKWVSISCTSTTGCNSRSLCATWGCFLCWSWLCHHSTRNHYGITHIHILSRSELIVCKNIINVSFILFRNRRERISLFHNMTNTRNRKNNKGISRTDFAWTRNIVCPQNSLCTHIKHFCNLRKGITFAHDIEVNLSIHSLHVHRFILTVNIPMGYEGTIFDNNIPTALCRIWINIECCTK